MPHLVQQESPVLHFLQCDNFDPAAAARRLALYWKFRRDIFGPNRWLLPMNQTGAGALSPADVQVLRTGYLVYFPSNVTTGQRLPLITADFGKCIPGHGARLLFYYVTTIMTTHTDTRTGEGCLCLYIVTSAPRPPPNLDKMAWTTAQQALPLRVSKVFVVQAYEWGKEHLIDSLAFQTTRMIQFNSSRHVHVLGGQSVAETVRVVQSAGISPACLPQAMGGDYHAPRAFEEWVRMRISLEDIMSASHPILSWQPTLHQQQNQTRTRALPVRTRMMTADDKTNRASPVSPNENGSHSSNGGSTSPKGRTPSNTSSTTLISRKEDAIRQRKAASARRAYQKQKWATLALQEQVRAWQDRNDAARNEHNRLCALLKQAQSVLGGDTNMVLPSIPQQQQRSLPLHHGDGGSGAGAGAAF